MLDLLKLFLFGTTQFGLGLVFLTVGGQMVSATENALINTLETPLAVAWVWFCFSEAPSVANFAGGVIVMAAVVGMSGRAIGVQGSLPPPSPREQRKQRGAPGAS
jgi:drug/metabolite transporter (DMT)-like permease